MTSIGRSRLLAAIVAVAMIAVAVVGVRLSEAGPAAQLVRGNTGEVLAIRGGSVQVVEVRVGTGVKRYGTVDPTNGMFVVARIALAVTGDTKLSLQKVELLAEPDRTYDTYGIVNGIAAEPGFVATTELVFEVDPAHLDNLTLTIAPLEIVSGYQQHVQVHLGITSDNASQWREAAQNQVVTVAPDTNRGLT